MIYVFVGFRQGAPEISPHNKGFMVNLSLMASANMDEFVWIGLS